jgi:hypothetical protein
MGVERVSKFEGWYADTTLFADGHIEYFVYDPDGEKWGVIDTLLVFLDMEARPYSVTRRQAKRIDKHVCKSIAKCKKLYDARKPLAKHVKVDC